MNVKTAIKGLIDILEIVAAATSTTIDNTVLGLLKAVYASEAFIDVLQTIWDKIGGTSMPDGAMPMIDANHPGLAEAFNASPALQEWARTRPRAKNSPEGTEDFSIGTVLTVISFLPTLFKLFKAWRDAQSGTAK